MKINLSIVLDLEGNNRVDLYSTNSLIEMDEYLLKFKNHREVREIFKDDIQEFLLDNKEYIYKTEAKNKRINNGRICITFVGKGNIVRMVPIIYQNSYKLINDKSVFAKIKKSLENDVLLKELYDRKKYLLSQYEIDLLKNYFLFPVSYKKYKSIFINFFVDKLKSMNEDKCYYYLRSLMNICNLVDKPRIVAEKGVIDNISDIPDNYTIVRENIYENCKDFYFIKLLEDGNDEELFKNYSLDEILKNCDYEKIVNQRKSRR